MSAQMLKVNGTWPEMGRVVVDGRVKWIPAGTELDRSRRRLVADTPSPAEAVMVKFC